MNKLRRYSAVTKTGIVTVCLDADVSALEDELAKLKGDYEILNLRWLAAVESDQEAGRKVAEYAAREYRMVEALKAYLRFGATPQNDHKAAIVLSELGRRPWTN